MMFVQRQPFVRDNDYLGSLRGPLYPFEFMSTRTAGTNLQALKFADFLRAVAQRAVLSPADDRGWGGHPCIADKVSAGYVKILNKEVDYLVYFATDLGLYPVAWRALSKEDGTVLISYWVKHLQTLPASNSASAFVYPDVAVYRYEKALQQIGYHYPSGTNPEDVSLSIDSTKGFTGLEINRITPGDFTLTPKPGTEIENTDLKAAVSFAIQP